MRIDISEANGAAARMTETEQTAEDNAAIAAQHEYECVISRSLCDAISQRVRIGDDALLVARASRRPHEVEIRRRVNVAVIMSGKTLD
jgi:hypothetical protein